MAVPAVCSTMKFPAIVSPDFRRYRAVRLRLRLARGICQPSGSGRRVRQHEPRRRVRPEAGGVDAPLRVQGNQVVQFGPHVSPRRAAEYGAEPVERAFAGVPHQLKGKRVLDLAAGEQFRAAR